MKNKGPGRIQNQQRPAGGGIARNLAIAGAHGLDQRRFCRPVCRHSRAPRFKFVRDRRSFRGTARGTKACVKSWPPIPLLDGGQILSDADSLLISIVGGPDLMMNEIQKVMEPLSRQCENANIILGAAIDAKFAGRLSITLIASSHCVESAPASAPPAAPVPEKTVPQEVAALEFVDTSETTRPALWRFSAWLASSYPRRSASKLDVQELARIFAQKVSAHGKEYAAGDRLHALLGEKHDADRSRHGRL